MNVNGRWCSISCTENHVQVSLNPARIVLSSAVVGGGLTLARRIVNLKVDKHPKVPDAPLGPPEQTILDYCRQQGWQGPVVGMMTAAAMSTFRRVERREAEVQVTALVTAGISNAGRAGDPAEYRAFDRSDPGAGTVNIILLTNAALTHAALVEAVITATEAKAAAFESLGIRSVATGLRATGTGTDAVAVVTGPGPERIRFCGKHVLFGEMLADVTIRAIADSLAGYREPR